MTGQPDARHEPRTLVCRRLGRESEYRAAG